MVRSRKATKILGGYSQKRVDKLAGIRAASCEQEHNSAGNRDYARGTGKLEKNGAPADVFIGIEQPSKVMVREIMKQCDLIMATGSNDMVNAVYSSGKPYYGVGDGNAVIVVDETVNLQETAEMIRIGKIGDNVSGCSAENSLVIQRNIYDELIESLKAAGGYLCGAEEKKMLQKAMWEDKHLHREIIAKDVQTIASEAGIAVPENTQFLLVGETGVGPDVPFSGEKLSLVLTLFKYDTFDDALVRVNEITDYCGLGHSCEIHSTDRDRIFQLALRTKTSRITVRQPHGVANSGNWYNGPAFTFSFGCGTWGGNSISENVTKKHFVNISRNAEPIDRKEPLEEEIYGDLLEGLKV